MKNSNFSRSIYVLILCLFSGITTLAQTSYLIPDSAGNYTVTNLAYMPECAQLTGNQPGWEEGAFIAAVPGNATTHFSPMYCLVFGNKPSGNSRLGLVMSPNPDLNALATSLSQPTRPQLVFEFENATANDYLHVWKYQNGFKQTMDTVLLDHVVSDLADGESHDLMLDYHSPDPSWPGDPNAYRIKLMMDGIVIYDSIYNFQDSLFGGQAQFDYWIAAQSGPGLGNVQTACIHTWDCVSPLATTFEMVDAMARDGEVEVDWQIATTDALEYFEVERSSDGAEFEVVGRVPAASEARYDFRDAEPREGMLYYRVQAVDRDGNRTASEVRQVLLSQEMEVVIYPTVVREGRLNVTSAEPAEVQVHDLHGKLLRLATMEKGQITLDLSGIASGMYLVNVNGKEKRKVVRIVVP